MKVASFVVIALGVLALAALWLIPIGTLMEYGIRSSADFNLAMLPTFWIISSGVCSLVCQSILVPKGYGRGASFAIGLFLNVVGVVVALLMHDKGSSAATETDKATALAEYARLLESGAITQEEYDGKKRELMGR